MNYQNLMRLMNLKTKILNLTLSASFLLCFTFSSFSGLSLAQAEQNPRPLGSDNRIRHVIYNPNEVYEVKATYGFQTTLEFEEEEAVQVASIGDSIAWQVIPVQNRIFLKPVEQNPRTNLTVVTSKRTYYFQLATVNPRLAADMTYLVRFEYPKAEPVTQRTIFKAKSPADYNFGYKLKKDKKSGLLRAFDNGEFTYLQFKDLTDLPAIFLIDSEDNESVINYRIEGPYVVIERVAPKLIFRRNKVVGELLNQSKSIGIFQSASPIAPVTSQEVPHG